MLLTAGLPELEFARAKLPKPQSSQAEPVPQSLRFSSLKVGGLLRGLLTVTVTTVTVEVQHLS